MEEEDESQSELMAKASKIVRDKISQIDHEMREISLDMHDHPEIEWQERRAHDLFVTYLSKQKGWKVVPHAGGVETAFSATFTHQVPGRDDFRTIGFQSELDALPGIGHACGHNLIAMSGLTASLALAEVLVRLDVPGRIVLLGTPAEEGGGGKLKLLDAGLYKEMDACLMLHPAPESGTGTMLAVQAVTVTFKGRTAHAGAAPWEGVNALDAAVLAYTNISALRQQIEPTMRVHGIIQGKDWAPNVIPGESTMTYNVRAPTISEVKVLASRVQKCFEAAALATGCEGQYEWDRAYADVRNSPSLSRTYSAYMKKENGIVVEDTPFMASTDFGNVTYALPSMHAEYKIHLDDKKTQGNHTVGFTAAARTEEAHERTMEACIGMILTGFRILEDAKFNESVWKEWKEWRDGADGP
ncbi:hypothetical protein IE53DRAFT_312585 [Violaceomyces palustris]|uniref:Uncharacterized protein n=1 Tax=Violaceomyces palustris TaxID=1673888 RepID=A0ACD0P2G6_9BASI|nr:hypothetical protein IE53DRAFT_312585 [Violaceomyces palustris]